MAGTEARGLVGYFFPWLIQSETLHYGYAVVMLIGLWTLRPGFTGLLDRRWWTIALAIQFFHHIEHLLLIIQATTGYNLGGRPVPTSLVQMWVPRVELHFFYNTIVFIPMVVAMYYHMFPSTSDARAQVHMQLGAWSDRVGVTPSAPSDVLRWRFVGRFLRWRYARTTLQLVLLLAASVLMLHGLFGPQVAPANLATVLSWVQCRGWLIIALLVAGNFFYAGCPFVLVRDAVAVRCHRCDGRDGCA